MTTTLYFALGFVLLLTYLVITTRLKYFTSESDTQGIVNRAYTASDEEVENIFDTINPHSERKYWTVPLVLALSLGGEVLLILGFLSIPPTGVPFSASIVLYLGALALLIYSWIITRALGRPASLKTGLTNVTAPGPGQSTALALLALISTGFLLTGWPVLATGLGWFGVTLGVAGVGLYYWIEPHLRPYLRIYALLAVPLAIILGAQGLLHVRHLSGGPRVVLLGALMGAAVSACAITWLRRKR